VPTIEVAGEQNDEICAIEFRPAKKQSIELPGEMSLHCSCNDLELPDAVLRNVEVPPYKVDMRALYFQ
jgi:hypothetical protein